MVDNMLAYRGIIVTYQTIREWAEKFGREYANIQFCMKRPAIFVPPSHALTIARDVS